MDLHPFCFPLHMLEVVLPEPLGEKLCHILGVNFGEMT